MRHHLAAALVAGIVTLSVPAVAAPLVYSETVDGNLDSTFRSLGSLGAGVNSVSGFRSGFERFNVTLPGTLRLTDVTLVVSNLALQDAQRSFGALDIPSVFSPALRFTTNGTFNPFSGTFDGEASLNVSLLGATIAQGNVGVSYDYVVSFTVAEKPAPVPVPEPMSLALFGLGLAGLGALRARRRAA